MLDKDERGSFVASLLDKDSGKLYQACIVCGYPVLTAVPYGTKLANKPDWNKFLMVSKTSHSDSLRDVLRFLRQWSGAAEDPAYSFQ